MATTPPQHFVAALVLDSSASSAKKQQQNPLRLMMRVNSSTVIFSPFSSQYKSLKSLSFLVQNAPFLLEQKCSTPPSFGAWNWLHHFTAVAELPFCFYQQVFSSCEKDRGNMVKIIEVHCCHMCKRFWLITGAIYDQFVEGISSNISRVGLPIRRVSFYCKTNHLGKKRESI